MSKCGAIVNLAQRRRKKSSILMAVEYLIEHQVTYRQAARMFGVTINQLRTRINYRHGSLAAARMHKEFRERHWGRPCIICGSTEMRPYGQYRCDSCLREAAKTFDGVV